MNPFLKFVEKIETDIAKARNRSATGTTYPLRSTKTALLFSPHPDDECITGLLPLRLMRERGMGVVNIPVTFGSDPGRRSQRATELLDACGFLGFSVHRAKQDLAPLGVDDVCKVLEHFEPELIFAPHRGDWNARHISTHHLVMDSLEKMGPDFSTGIVETEYWAAMPDPNLMVGADAETVADLVAAASMHRGEMERTPYHLLLPAWMLDNTRRGSELVGGQGNAAPDFSFATLYRLRQWQRGRVSNTPSPKKIVGVEKKASLEVF